MRKSVKDRLLAVLFAAFVVINIVVFVKLFQIVESRPVGDRPEGQPRYIFILAIYIAGYLMYLLHIAIHELGHVIFGKLTGYRFSSYRFLSFGIGRVDGKWKFFRLHIPGTAGQSIMLPPNVKRTDKKPYFWYNAGGVCLNLIVVYLSFGICMATTNRLLYLFAMMSAIMGFLTAIINGVPYSKKGITDGCNILQFYCYPERVSAFYSQFNALGELSRGKTWMDFSPKEFETENAPDNGFEIGGRINQINTYYARRNFEKAAEVLAEMVPYKHQVSKIHGSLITMEQLFQELIGENDSEKVEQLYTKQIQNMMKAMKTESSVWRIKMAYEWFQNEDKAEAMVCYEKMKKIRENTMYPGDAESDIALGDYIKERMEQTDVLHLE